MESHIIALAGLTGSGKSTVAELIGRMGYQRIRFGDVTEEELRKRKLEINEANERIVRGELRQKYGMDAYAKLNRKKIDTFLKKGNVVIDGMYSMEEYLFMKEHYPERLYVVAVYASPETRYSRLGSRKVRPLTKEESWSRDLAEIRNLNKAGPIAMADYTIINEGSEEELEKRARELMQKIQKPR